MSHDENSNNHHFKSSSAADRFLRKHEELEIDKLFRAWSSWKAAICI